MLNLILNSLGLKQSNFLSKALFKNFCLFTRKGRRSLKFVSRFRYQLKNQFLIGADFDTD
jgi:hypothetical protein